MKYCGWWGKLKLVCFQYQLENSRARFELSPDKPLELGTEDFALFTKVVFAPESLTLQPEDFVTLKFVESDETTWVYRLDAEGEHLSQDGRLPETITDLAHLIASKWGVTSPAQLHNLLVLNQGEPTQTATGFLSKLAAMEEAITALTGEAVENLRQEVDNVCALQREIAHINGMRRLLWSKVCQVQEQTEKFAASVQGIIGSPVKPEYIAELEEIKERINRFEEQIADLNSKIAALMPEYDGYRRALSMFWLGLSLLILTVIGWYLGFHLGELLIGSAIVGVGLLAFAAVWYRKNKAGADHYFDCQDQLLDAKTDLRRTKKELKKHLAGTDEAELLRKYYAQQEADRIRAELDYRLDRYTKAWQKASPQGLQAQLGEANNRVFTLCQESRGTEVARELADKLSARQRLVVELEAVTHREDFFSKRDYENAATEKLVAPDLWQAVLTPAEAPAIQYVNPAQKFSINQDREEKAKQLIIVRLEPM